MYTLSLFPSLLSFGLLAPLLLRLTLGIVVFFWGYHGVKSAGSKDDPRKIAFNILDLIVGVLLIVGLFTQLAALITAVILTVKLVNKARAKALFTDGVNYYFILFVIALSLLFSGAGFLGFDLPL
jgi:uncharacterized membrane protein YphA (DoxX/SURF4 family)